MAELIGAVNTIQINERGWTGYNTDYAGFLQPLNRFKGEIRNAPMIGAGGAARAVVLGLSRINNIDRIDIVNRSLENAENIADFIQRIPM